MTDFRELEAISTYGVGVNPSWEDSGYRYKKMKRSSNLLPFKNILIWMKNFTRGCELLGLGILWFKSILMHMHIRWPNYPVKSSQM